MESSPDGRAMDDMEAMEGMGGDDGMEGMEGMDGMDEDASPSPQRIEDEEPAEN